MADSTVISRLVVVDNKPVKLEAEVVCLCGSTRFKEEFLEVTKELTFQGVIVLSVGCFGHADNMPLDFETKLRLDRLHKKKILLADRVHVINVGGYIGSSTRSEIEFALALGKPVTYFHGPVDEKIKP